MRQEVDTARTVKCVVTGKPLQYKGYGRPPKYTPEARKAEEKKRRKARYDAKNKAKAPGKRGRPSKKAA